MERKTTNEENHLPRAVLRDRRVSSRVVRTDPGEKLFTEATAGDGLIELTIPLDYRRQDVKPSYIVLTASASKGGDFFSGSSSSKMWLDDFELVY